MLFVFLAFWLLLFLGREELGPPKIAGAIVLWCGLLAGCLLGEVPILFMSAQAVLDIGLVLLVFGGDLRIH